MVSASIRGKMAGDKVRSQARIRDKMAVEDGMEKRGWGWTAKRGVKVSGQFSTSFVQAQNVVDLMRRRGKGYRP